MIYGYIRISTKNQIYGTSIDEQKELILQRYPNAELIVDVYSGVKNREKLNNILMKVQPGDTVVSTKLDRFCRSAREGLEYADMLFNKHVNLHILNMGLIENTPIGRMLLTSLLAYAEFERSMIVERTQDGRILARRNPNYKEGRKPKYGTKKLNHALELLESHTYREVEELTGISKSTMIRYKNSLKKTSEN